MKVNVIYQDEALLVLDKPSGLLSVPGRGADKQDCLSLRVQQLCPEARIVHRLDMATSGLMVMTRTAAAQRDLNAAFAARLVHKRYEAMVDGVPGVAQSPELDTWHTIDLPIWLDWANRPRRVIDPTHGKPSVTHWRVLSSDAENQRSRLALKPVTGRSHQLRLHLQAIGHAILGDALYASPVVAARAERLLLHATQLAFTHPVNLQPMLFTSPAPF